IPQMDVWRPADPVESALAWASAIDRADGPSSLLFTRQAVPFLTRSEGQVEAIRRGGSVLRDAAQAQAVIIATGSEVGIAIEARERLLEDGIEVRIVSMPSTTVFDRQDAAWKASVLPAGVPRVAIEAGVTGGWYKYVGLDGAVIGLDRFGESAPAGELFKHFGITAEAVAQAVRIRVA